MSNSENKTVDSSDNVKKKQYENEFLNDPKIKKGIEDIESNFNDIIDKKTNVDDNFSIYFMDFPKRKNMQMIKLLKEFSVKFIKFYGIRALISLIKKVLKLKFRLNKLSLRDFFEIIFNQGNLRTGLFLSVMPLIFSFLTEVLFDVNKKENNSQEKLDSNFSNFNNDKNIINKMIILLSGFIAAFIGISFAEKGVKIMNYIILSILVRSIHSLIVVYLKHKGKEIESKFWAFIAFYLACFGFLFLAYYNPGFKPILKLYSNYANFEGTEKEEVYSTIQKLKYF